MVRRGYYLGKTYKEYPDNDMNSNRRQCHREEVSRGDRTPARKQLQIGHRISGDVYGRHAFDNLKDARGLAEVAPSRTSKGFGHQPGVLFNFS
jgi:hypothetical protein